jgi:hypothetical protein
MDRDQHVAHYCRKKFAELANRCGFAAETIAPMCFAAPWLAAINWRLAEGIFACECRWPLLPGSILVGVFRKR